MKMKRSENENCTSISCSLNNFEFFQMVVDADVDESKNRCRMIYAHASVNMHRDRPTTPL